jgi:hypothetical protein
VSRAKGSIAPSLTLLFAGMFVGIVVGMVALLPSMLERRSARLALEEKTIPVPAALVAPMPPPPPAPPAVEPDIDPDQSLVTFLAVSKGQRVLVDGRVVLSSEATPIKCGKHSVRVGGTKRKVTFPCGAALTLD